MNWKPVSEYPELVVRSDDDTSLVEDNVMNPCLVTDGEHFQEAYMLHIKYSKYEQIAHKSNLPETWGWYCDDRTNPVNQEMWLDFTPTHWCYIKDIKPE